MDAAGFALAAAVDGVIVAFVVGGVGLSLVAVSGGTAVLVVDIYIAVAVDV